MRSRGVNETVSGNLAGNQLLHNFFFGWPPQIARMAAARPRGRALAPPPYGIYIPIGGTYISVSNLPCVLIVSRPTPAHTHKADEARRETVHSRASSFFFLLTAVSSCDSNCGARL
jgi:hypothetical protein